MRRMAAVGLFALGALAGTPEGLEALKKEDYAAALQEFTAASEAGDAEARFQLGEMYRRGLGMAVNLRLAEQYYGQADAQGHMQAAAEWGVLLWKGKKKQAALRLLHKAAGADCVTAMYALATLADRGIDVGTSEKERVEYFRKAAEAGHPDAQVRYAVALETGKVGGEPLNSEAEGWYRKAAAQGHPEGYTGIARRLLLKPEAPGHSPDIATHEEVIACYRRGALLGDSEAQLSLATMLTSKQPADAYAWAIIASNADYASPAIPKRFRDVQRHFGAKCRRRFEKGADSISPALQKEGAAYARDYAKEILASLKRPLAWDDPEG